MTDSKDEEKLARIMNSLAESVFDASDEEVIAETKELGLQAETEAESVRELFKSAAKAHRQRKLAVAKTKYEESVAKLRSKDYRLPGDALERRKLLMTTLAARPDVRSAITIRHRDFADWTDDDVVSALKQLKELGFVDPEKD